MSWFMIEEPSTGRVASPFERLPLGPLRFRAHPDWTLRADAGASVLLTPDDAGTSAWLVTPEGPFSLVLEGPDGAWRPLRFDDVSVAPRAAPPTPPTPAPVPSAQQFEERASPSEATVPPPAEGTVMAPWGPRELALALLAAPSRTVALVDLARRAEEAGRRVREMRQRCDELPARDRDEVAVVLGLLGEVASELGRVPPWVADPRAAKAQREIYCETLDRAGASVAASAGASVGLLHGDVFEVLLARLPVGAAPVDDGVEARLAAVVEEIERIDESLGALSGAVRAMNAGTSHIRDVRQALEARAAIRALSP